ncbi:MAG: CHAD domain-containing protein, partial [Alphaproteobacteria bacterium]
MAQRIGKDEDLARALLRLVREDLAAVAGNLAVARDLVGVAERGLIIHQARRRLKAARAVCWALEHRFKGDARVVRKRLGKAARLLSDARDADVMAATAAAMGFGAVAEKLKTEAPQASAATPSIDRARRRVLTASKRLERLAADFNGRAVFRQALDRAYRHGRNAMRRARRSGRTQDLHAWRKATKRLYFLLEPARGQLPSAVRSHIRRIDDLGELLGLDH